MIITISSSTNLFALLKSIRHAIKKVQLTEKDKPTITYAGSTESHIYTIKDNESVSIVFTIKD